MTTKDERGLQREDSLEADVLNTQTPDDREYATKDNEEEDYNLPPGRLHSMRGPQRLSGSKEALFVPPGLSNILRKKTEGLSTPRSRSRSPSLKDKTTITTHDASSSISSLEDIVDQDILYDRAGLEDKIEQPRPHPKKGEATSLPAVNERLSEETLDDVHAFSDFVRSSNASRANSIGTGAEGGLAALDECEEETESDLEDIDELPEGQVILTNLENLTLEQDHAAAARGTRGTGESSLQEEAPSAPTA